MYKTICCVCGKFFLTIVPQGATKYDFCSDKCWNNAPASLPNHTA